MPNDLPANAAPSAETQLLEYTLADRVMERVLSRTKYFVVAFLAGLTLLGVLGAPLMQDYASIEAVNTRYLAVRSEVSRIENELRQTNEAVAAAKRSTETLAKAVVETNAGRPAILGITFHEWKDGVPARIIITGANLGDRPGKVSVRVQLSRPGGGPSLGVSDPIMMDTTSVRDWKNHKIEIVFSQAVQSEWAAALKKLIGKAEAANQKVGTTSATVELETSTGTRVSL